MKLNYILDKIKSFFIKITKKDKYLPLPKEISSHSNIIKENIVIPKKAKFIDNIYEINSLQYKLENNQINLSSLSEEMKIKLSEEYSKQINQLKLEICLIREELNTISIGGKL